MTVTLAMDTVPFLRALVLARKSFQLYPPGNPAVDTALTSAVDLLHTLTADGPLVLRLQRDGLLAADAPIPDPDGRFGRFAEDLYRRAVGALTFQAGVTADDLGAVLNTLNRSVEELLATGGPAAQPTVAAVRTITIEHAEGIEIAEAHTESSGPQETDVLERAEALVASEDLEEPAGFQRFFLGVSEGDPDRIHALQQLLAAPDRLTLLYKGFALRVREQHAGDTGMVMTELMRIIEAAESISRDLESDAARQRLYRGTAEMIRGLDPSEQDSLIIDGLIPRVPLRGFEARILRLFPVPELAGAFARAVVLNEGAVGLLQECFSGLALDEDSQEVLGLLVHSQLEDAGDLTPDLDAFLASVASGRLPSTLAAPILDMEDLRVLLPANCGLPDTAVRWEGGEYRKLRREARRAALRSTDMDLLQLLRELLAVEQQSDDYGLLLEQARRLLVSFLDRGQYAQATELIDVLTHEREARAATLAPEQLAQLDQLQESLTETGLVNRLLRTLNAAEPHSREAERIMAYLRGLGEPLILCLLDRLDQEQSRQMRLIICGTVGHLVSDSLEVLAHRLNHREWYVVRNILAILGEIATPAVVPLARQGLAHADMRVVREAAKTVAKIHSPEAVDAIVALLDHPDAARQAVGVSWLGIMGRPEAVPALLRLLEPDPYAIDQEFCLAVIDTLGRLASPEARAMLDRLAARGRWLGRRRRAPVREAALAALRGRKGKRA